MGVHPVGEGLDEDRPVPAAALLQRPPRDGERGQHVVAVNPDPGEAVAAGPLVEGDAALPLHRFGDGPLVVLAEEDDGGVVDGAPDEGLVHVALAGRAVAEEDDGGLGVGAVVPVTDPTVEPLAHGVADRVQALVADDDRVGVEAGGHRVPAAVVGAPEDAEQLGGVDAPAPGHSVLPVAGEGHVPGAHRPAGADLRGFLAQQRDPDAQLALPLERVGLAVGSTDQDHVPVQPAQLVGRDVDVEVGVRNPLPLGGQQLHEVGATFAGGA